jgi:hypothetical protein
MADWEHEFYDSWDDAHQGLYDHMADRVGSSDLYDDVIMQGYVDVLFGDEPARGADRHELMDALHDYFLDVYDFDFDEVWDWESWRELYE